MIYGYLRVSSDDQDVHTQRVAIDEGLDFRDYTEVLIEMREP